LIIILAMINPLHDSPQILRFRLIPHWKYELSFRLIPHWTRLRLRREGYFDVPLVRELWQTHLQGKCDNQILLWNILMFQAWLEEV